MRLKLKRQSDIDNYEYIDLELLEELLTLIYNHGGQCTIINKWDDMTPLIIITDEE